MWDLVRWGAAHQRQRWMLLHLFVSWPKDWQLAHWVEGPKSSLRSARRVEEKANSRLRVVVFWARAPVSEITIENLSCPSVGLVW